MLVGVSLTVVALGVSVGLVSLFFLTPGKRSDVLAVGGFAVSLLGVLVFTTITNIFILNNLATETQNIAKGVIIIGAVLLQRRATRTT